MMLIDEKFKLGQSVYLKTDKDQEKRIVTHLMMDANGLKYGLSCGTSFQWHHDIEIAEEINILEVTTR